MLPLEVVFVMVLLIWGMAGVVRGFSKEIGATIAIVLAMTAVRLFGPLAVQYYNKLAGKVAVSYQVPVAATIPADTNPFCAAVSQEQFIFYSLVFCVIVFMGYQGKTFEVPVNFNRITGSVTGFFIGMLNGYLIAGNLWYFLDRCALYNVPRLGITNVGVLSPTAQTIVKILPLNIIGEPLVLLGALFLLLILRIAK
jgi:uncharacterized membrane protein required for colicin V production